MTEISTNEGRCPRCGQYLIGSKFGYCYTDVNNYPVRLTLRTEVGADGSRRPLLSCILCGKTEPNIVQRGHMLALGK